MVGKISDFIFQYVKNIKFKILVKFQTIFLYVEKIKSELFGAVSDFIFLYVKNKV